MSHWNSNGLVERVLTERIRRIKRKEEMEKVDIIDEKDTVSKKIDKYKLTIDEKDRLAQVTKYMHTNYSTLDSPEKKHILEEYIYLSIKPAIKDQRELDIYTYYKVTVSDSLPRNFLSCHITINFYTNNYNYETGISSNSINVDLRELFKNCSSIVISKLTSDIFYNSPYDNGIPGDYENLVHEYIKVLESICIICNYTTILYTASLKETNKYVLSYLKDNYTNSLQFNNKRGGNTIVYYTKQL